MEKGITTLYFLARDGYFYYRIAEKYVKEFDLNRLNIAQFCNLTLTFLKVKTNDRKFYSNLKKKSTLVDPKVLYREYRSYFPDSITQVWVNNNAYLPQYDNEWYNCEIKYLLSYISRVTGLFLQFDSKSYKKVIFELKRLSDDFYNDILNLSIISIYELKWIHK